MTVSVVSSFIATDTVRELPSSVNVQPFTPAAQPELTVYPAGTVQFVTVDALFGAAVNVTVAVLPTETLQVPLAVPAVSVQLRPLGLLVIVPVPPPEVVNVTVLLSVNVFWACKPELAPTAVR